MNDHGFSADARTPVRFVADEELAYVMTRYREVHDFLHVLSGLPTTVVGEVALKWLEMAQTGLPVAALSALVGPLRLGREDRALLLGTLAPWALRTAAACPPLIAVRYEDLLPLPLAEARVRLGIVPAPPLA
jgi:ubiquinone biosynthesis protein COQ4